MICMTVPKRKRYAHCPRTVASHTTIMRPTAVRYRNRSPRSMHAVSRTTHGFSRTTLFWLDELQNKNSFDRAQILHRAVEFLVREARSQAEMLQRLFYVVPRPHPALAYVAHVSFGRQALTFSGQRAFRSPLHNQAHPKLGA
jgi:hypothetical protein